MRANVRLYLALNLYTAITDPQLFAFLREQSPDEMVFWRQDERMFRALQSDERFLLVSPGKDRKIIGFGFFAGAEVLPASQAWELFGPKLGCPDWESFSAKLAQARKKAVKAPLDNPLVQCILLNDPILLKDEDQFEVPSDFQKQVVTGKMYPGDSAAGAFLYTATERQRAYYWRHRVPPEERTHFRESSAYQRLVPRHIRGGAESFRRQVREAYGATCAISGSRVLPTLEAAHIHPYHLGGPHVRSNGLLLRIDFHRLFDRGYFTLTPDLHLEFSPRFARDFPKDEFYLPFDGTSIASPTHSIFHPAPEYIHFHREQVFLDK